MYSIIHKVSRTITFSSWIRLTLIEGMDFYVGRTERKPGTSVYSFQYGPRAEQKTILWCTLLVNNLKLLSISNFCQLITLSAQARAAVTTPSDIAEIY